MQQTNTQATKQVLIILLVIFFVGLGYLMWRQFDSSKAKMTTTNMNGQNMVQSPTVVIPKTTSRDIGPFRGTLPCSDCQGIDTVIILTKVNTIPNADGQYRLIETNIGKGGPITTIGYWKAIKGTPQNPNEEIYELNPTEPSAARYFLKLGEDSIRMLDANKQEMKDMTKYTLNKQ